MDTEDLHKWIYVEEVKDPYATFTKCRWRCPACGQTMVSFDRPDFDLKFYVGNAGPFSCNDFVAAQVMES